MLQAVINVQSTETTAVVESRNVSTFVVGHPKLKVMEAESVHVVRTVIAGVENATDVVAGHEMVTGTVEGGKVTVVTVAPGTVTVERMPVK